MTPRGVDVGELLRAEGLRTEAGREGTLWMVKFSYEDVETIVYINQDPAEDYLVAIAPIQLCKLEELQAETLRELIRTNSGRILAKIEHIVIGRGELLIASTECAVEGITGKKLRRRVEACALLAHDCRKVLKSLRVGS